MDANKQIKTILVVDDSMTSLLTLSAICQENFKNAVVLEATSAKEAFPLLEENRVDIILSDVDMPEINGFEFVKRLKQKKATQDIPIIFVTAHDKLDEFEQETTEIDAYDYIKKPVNVKIIVSKINNYFKIFDTIHSKEKVINENIIYSETDLQGRITYASEAFQHICGYTREELIGNDHSLLRHPDVPKQTYEEMWSTIQAGDQWTGTIINKTKAGGFYITKATVFPRYENGRLVGYASARQDITKEELEKRRGRKIFDAQDALIVIFEEAKMQDINHTLLDVFDFSSLSDFFSKHDSICELFVQQNDEALMPVMPDGSYWLEYVKKHKDGPTLAYMPDKDGDLRTYEVRYRGHISPTEEIIIFNDVTSLQMQSAQLQEQSRLAAMGEMIAMIAHQWRQPLAGLSALMTKLNLQKKMGTLEDEEWKRSVEKHKELVTYMSKTIDDFKGFLDKSDRMESVEIGSIASRSYNFVEPLFRKYGVAFEITYEDERLKDATIQAVASKLDQVIMNLYKNSLDEFIAKKREDGQISVHVRQAEANLIIEVCDNAGGIPGEILPKVFDPYFSTKGKNGTGIGLYMSKTIVEEHLKGKIAMANTKEGVCCTIMLPK